MARMTAARAAVEILKREGVSNAFGVPGAAINPFYAALQAAAWDQSHARPARRGRLAHGGGLHPDPPGQHRCLHRYVRTEQAPT